MTRSTIGLFLGPFLFLLVLLLPTPEGVETVAMRVAAVTVLMATWWITQAIPIPATSLLPIMLFPLLGVMDGAEVTLAYGNHVIFLFLGGFLIAVTVQKWNLHKRIALHTIRVVGVTPQRIILGFMLTTAILSMLISNTAATMLMVTIGLAVLQRAEEKLAQQPGNAIDTRPGHFRFGIALMLGIAYSSSIGGVATLIGTPPNAIFAGVVEQTYQQTIGFVDWMKFAMPLSILMLTISWLYLTRFAFPSGMTQIPGSRDTFDQELAELGPISSQERKVFMVLILVAVLWFINGLVTIEALQFVKDSTIAIACALLLFIIPSDFKKREFLLDWKTVVTIPWDILILFGGGFALALGFVESGLTKAVAEQLTVLEGTNLSVIVAGITTLVVLLTEFTSNTATASISLPIMIALAEAMQVHPFGLMITATLAASFAFMLPVATPPNAIVFGSRYVTIPQMVKAGIWLYLIGMVLITCFVTLVLPLVWGIDIDTFPPEFVSG
ncbi:MAG: anion transporter [Gammaproteobacteria bacterium RIFCSPLOWO2_12_47_11]|nr:MAG: anion transporter [Gammaproteobacteria bacterium RIFCSPLOWO2_12_47_11]